MRLIRQLVHRLFCNAVCKEHRTICYYELRNHPAKHWCRAGNHEYE